MIERNARAEAKQEGASAERENRYVKFKERALARREVRESFEEGLDWLRLAASIAALREKRGLTQTQLAAKLHTSQAAISRIERGSNVQLKTLKRVAEALQAELKIELVKNEDSPEGSK